MTVVRCERSWSPSVPQDRFGQAEVQHFHLALRRNLDVGGFQVAVNDAFLMSGFQSICDLAANAEGCFDRQRTIPRDSFPQRLAGHEFHHQAIDVAGFFEAVDGCDIGMIQRSQSARLAAEARQPFGVTRELIRQCLDGDIAPELVVVRTIYLAHASGA